MKLRMKNRKTEVSAVSGKKETDRLTARLEMIRRRHRKLILEPREAIAAELDEDSFDDPLDEMTEADELELMQASDVRDL